MKGRVPAPMGGAELKDSLEGCGETLPVSRSLCFRAQGNHTVAANDMGTLLGHSSCSPAPVRTQWPGQRSLPTPRTPSLSPHLFLVAPQVSTVGLHLAWPRMGQQVRNCDGSRLSGQAKAIWRRVSSRACVLEGAEHI